MGIAISVIHYIVCVALIVIILLQAGRGHGLTGGMFGGEGSQSLFGAKSASFMTKMTTVAAIAFLVTSLGLDMYTSYKSKSLMLKSKKELVIPREIQEKVKEAAQQASETTGEAQEAAAVEE